MLDVGVLGPTSSTRSKLHSSHKAFLVFYCSWWWLSPWFHPIHGIKRKLSTSMRLLSEDFSSVMYVSCRMKWLEFWGLKIMSFILRVISVLLCWLLVRRYGEDFDVIAWSLVIWHYACLPDYFEWTQLSWREGFSKYRWPYLWAVDWPCLWHISGL